MKTRWCFKIFFCFAMVSLSNGQFRSFYRFGRIFGFRNDSRLSNNLGSGTNFATVLLLTQLSGGNISSGCLAEISPLFGADNLFPPLTPLFPRGRSRVLPVRIPNNARRISASDLLSLVRRRGRAASRLSPILSSCNSKGDSISFVLLFLFYLILSIFQQTQNNPPPLPPPTTGGVIGCQNSFGNTAFGDIIDPYSFCSPPCPTSFTCTAGRDRRCNCVQVTPAPGGGCQTPCHPQATCVPVNNIPSPGPFPPFEAPQPVVPNPGGGLPPFGFTQPVGNNPFGSPPLINNFPQTYSNPSFQNFVPNPVNPQPIGFPQTVDNFQNNGALPPIIGLPRSRIASRQANSNPTTPKLAAASNRAQQQRHNSAPQIRSDPLPPQLSYVPEEEYSPLKSNSSSLEVAETAKTNKTLNIISSYISDSFQYELNATKEESSRASFTVVSSNTTLSPLIQNNSTVSSTSATQETTTSSLAITRRTFDEELLKRILAAIAIVPEVAGHPDIKAKTKDSDSYDVTTIATTQTYKEQTLPVATESSPVTPQIEVLTHFNNTQYIFKDRFQALPLILGGSQTNQGASSNETLEVQRPIGPQQANEVPQINTFSNFSPSTELGEQIKEIPIITDISQNGVQVPPNENQNNDLNNQAQRLVELLEQGGAEIPIIPNVAQVSQLQGLEGAQTENSNQIPSLNGANQNLNSIIPNIQLQQIPDISSIEALPQPNRIPDFGTTPSNRPGENFPQPNFSQDRFLTGGNVPAPIGRLPESDNNFLVPNILNNGNQLQRIPTTPDLSSIGSQQQQQRIPLITDVPNRRRPQFNNIPTRNNNAQRPGTTQFERRPIGGNREPSNLPLIPDIPTVGGQPFGPLPSQGNFPQRQRIPENGGQFNGVFQQFNNNPVGLTPDIGGQQFGGIQRPPDSFQFGNQPVGGVTLGQPPFVSDIPNSVRRPGSFVPPGNFPFISDIQNIRRPPFLGNQPTNNFPQQPSTPQLGGQPFGIPQIQGFGNGPTGNLNQGFGESPFGVQPVGQIFPAGQPNSLNPQFPNPLPPPQFFGGAQQYQCRCIPGYFGDGVTSCLPSNNQRPDFFG